MAPKKVAEESAGKRIRLERELEKLKREQQRLPVEINKLKMELNLIKDNTNLPKVIDLVESCIDDMLDGQLDMDDKISELESLLK